MADYECVILGRVLMDIIARPIDGLPTFGEAVAVEDAAVCPGGSAANTALGMASLGIPVLLVTAVGNDLLGQELIRRIELDNIATDVVRRSDQPTSFCFVAISSGGSPKYFYNLGADTLLDRIEINKKLDVALNKPFARSLHLGGINLVDGLIGEELNSALSPISDRFGQIVISGDTSKVLDGAERNTVALHNFELLFTTAEEGAALTGAHTISGIGEGLLEFGTDVVVLKLGHRGAFVFSKAHSSASSVATVKLDCEVNSNGAGDVFAAAFISQWLKQYPKKRPRDLGKQELLELANYATLCAVEFISRSDLGRVARISEHDVEASTEWRRPDIDTLILPIQTCFETSDYNRNALDDATISSRYQEKVIEHIRNVCGSPENVVDFCCGGAWLPIRLADAGSIRRLSLFDKFEHQIKIANSNIDTHLSPSRHPPGLVVQRRDILSWQDPDKFDLGIVSFAIHLFGRSEKRKIASVAREALTDKGHLVVLTFSPDGVNGTLLHQYIDGFNDIDQARYIPIDDLLDIFAHEGFVLESRSDIEYEREYSSVADFMKFLRSKPFSTFYLLEEEIGSDGLDQALDRCESSLQERFGAGAVNNGGRVTLLILRNG